jgi:hypothetical protein
MGGVVLRIGHFKNENLHRWVYNFENSTLIILLGGGHIGKKAANQSFSIDYCLPNTTTVFLNRYHQRHLHVHQHAKQHACFYHQHK